MSHIIDKRITLNTHSSKSSSTQKILFLLTIDKNLIAAVQINAIIIYNTQLKQHVKAIELQFQVCQIVYNRHSQIFVIIPKCQDIATCQIHTLSYSEPHFFRSYYRYQENKPGVKQFEWQSWLKSFDLSPKIVLIRKFYGYSLCVVFDSTKDELTKRNEFKINQECISKLDQQKYMANYRQMISRYSLVLEIINVQTNKKSEYKITQEIVPNFTKSVKLYRKEKQITVKGNYTALIVLLAMNTKFSGYKLMIVKVFEETNNYMIIEVINQTAYQVYKIFPIDSRGDQFSSLQYRNDDFVLCNYKMDLKNNRFQQTDSKVIKCQFQGIVYNHIDKQVVMYQNDFQSNLSLKMFKFIDKPLLYAYLLNGKNFRAINQQIIDLLI